MRHILVREIFQKSVREKYKISLDLSNIFENYYNIIIQQTAIRASVQSVSTAQRLGVEDYNYIPKIKVRTRLQGWMGKEMRKSENPFIVIHQIPYQMNRLQNKSVVTHNLLI